MGFTCSELQGNFEALTMEVGLDFSSEELKAETPSLCTIKAWHKAINGPAERCHKASVM